MDKYLTEISMKEAFDALKALITELHQHAYKKVDAHWLWVRNMEKRQPGWENQSTLQVRCMLEGKDSTSIRFNWQHVEWRGSKAKNTRTKIRNAIARAKDRRTETPSKLPPLETIARCFTPLRNISSIKGSNGGH